MRAHDMHEVGQSVDEIAQAVHKRPEQIPLFVLLGERLRTVYEPDAPANEGERDGR